jgi:hypothetical protein
MSIDELEIYITPDGLGRAAIVRRNDGLLCIYIHWILAESVKVALGITEGGRTSWIGDKTPLLTLYEHASPEHGLYGTLDDARRAIRSLKGFSEADLRSPKQT